VGLFSPLLDAVALIRWEATMAGIRIFDVHRTWEDWSGILLGVLVGLSPWLVGQEGDQSVMWNAMLVGVLVLSLAALELVDLHRWEEVGEIACGAWLIASPYIFGYANAGALRYAHFGLGAVIVLLAVMELWQDRNLSDEQLARHGMQ
jgi:SPW repeat